MNEYQVVVCNVPDILTAKQLASLLLEQKLCACVNILPQVQSLYIWNDKIEEAQEVMLLIKTIKANYNQLEQGIKENHPYEVPEIIAVDIASGLPEYLDWVVNSTATK